MQNVFVKAETFKPEPAKKRNKVGVDTNVLIDFIRNPLTQQFVMQKIAAAEFITSNICIDEAKNKLENSEELDRILSSWNIKTINVTARDFQDGLKIKEKFYHLGAHEPDVFIIACFKNNSVTDVLSIDNGFLKVSEAVGMNPRKIPNADKINEIIFRKALRP